MGRQDAHALPATWRGAAFLPGRLMVLRVQGQPPPRDLNDLHVFSVMLLRRPAVQSPAGMVAFRPTPVRFPAAVWARGWLRGMPLP